MKKYHDKGVLNDRWIKKYCWNDWKQCVRFKMEERNETHPDWMLPDGSIDEKLKSYNFN